jgi:signal transduction histidine kinase
VDITDLKVAREAAEAANLATTEFLNNINHEIRTPLTVIAGYIGFLASPEMLPSHRAMKLLIEDPDADKTALGTAAGAYVVETKSYAKRTQTSLQHLLGLVRDTLDLSKIQNGNLIIDQENVELAPVLQECAQQFAQMAEQKGLLIEYSCAPLTVRVDHNRLRQILINVIGNALKFTREGRIKLACKEENGRACVTVADTGCGIAEEHQQDIFKRFWQADGSATREQGGTGLGLAISRNLVELMGGKIELQSKPGKGSVFTIWLPLAS